MSVFVLFSDYSQKSPSAEDFFDIDDVAEDIKVRCHVNFLHIIKNEIKRVIYFIKYNFVKFVLFWFFMY